MASPNPTPMFGEIDVLAVFVAAFAYMALGMLWYAPQLFGSIWAKEMGIDMSAGSKKDMGLAVLGGFVLAIVSAYVLSMLLPTLAWPEDRSLTAALWATFMLWLGFIMPLMLGAVLWKANSFTVFIIGASYQLFGFSLMATIIFYLL